MKFLRLLCFAACISYAPGLRAQGVHVTVFADTTVIPIGERLNLTFELTAPAEHQVRFPLWADTLDGFEIAGRGKLDTVDNGNQTLTYRQTLQLTRFDSGFCVINPQPFLFKDIQSSSFDTVRSEALLLTVNTLPVDTTRAIRDIKPPMEVPFTFRDLLPYLLSAAAIAGLVYLLVRLLKKRPAAAIPAPPRVPVVPPHVLALRALKELEEEKLWQQGFTKQYHTRLTDIVRQYIEKRFDVLAMEQTTDEILLQLERRTGEDGRDPLGQMLRLADLVKFAKVQPNARENESGLTCAREFIHLTQPVTPAEAEKKEVTT